MVRLHLYVLIFIVTGTNNLAIGQEKFQTENLTHIFWQPDRVLTTGDFQGDCSNNPKIIKYCEEHGLCTVASVGIFAVLDIPKKKRKRGELIEKAYFAPAFQKTTSCIIKSDSFGIEKQKITFDIFEVSARFARYQLKHLQDSIGGYGTISIMFKTIEARAIKFRESLSYLYTIDVFIDRREGSYKEWREKINKLLEEYSDFATRPEDCYRFVKNEPIDENYIKAETVIGNLDTK